MQRLFSSAIILVACLLVPAFASHAAENIGSIVITGEGRAENPTLLFRGVNGNSALSSRVLSDLKNCGWFNVVSSGAADYVVQGAASGNQLRLTLGNAAGATIQTISAQGADPVDVAHSAVDSVLKQLFNVEGICRTKIVFAAETGKDMKELYQCDFDGGRIRKLTKNATLSIDPVWNPNGKTIVYSYFGPSSTFLVELDLASMMSRKLTQYKGLNAGGALQPNGGKYLAMVLGRDNQVDLYMRPTDGGDLIRLTKDRAVEASPCWSPDGTKICYVSDVKGKPRLFIMDPFRKTRPVEVGDTYGTERVAPSWSRDGKIAYSARLEGKYTVAVVDMKSGTPRDLPIGADVRAPKRIPGEGPSWAPDNRHVVAAYNGVIYIVDTKLGKSRRLISGASKVTAPDWSPILY